MQMQLVVHSLAELVLPVVVKVAPAQGGPPHLLGAKSERQCADHCISQVSSRAMMCSSAAPAKCWLVGVSASFFLFGLGFLVLVWWTPASKAERAALAARYDAASDAHLAEAVRAGIKTVKRTDAAVSAAITAVRTARAASRLETVHSWPLLFYKGPKQVALRRLANLHSTRMASPLPNTDKLDMGHRTFDNNTKADAKWEKFAKEAQNVMGSFTMPDCNSEDKVFRFMCEHARKHAKDGCGVATAMNTGSGFLWVRHLCNDEEANKNDKTNVGDRYVGYRIHDEQEKDDEEVDEVEDDFPQIGAGDVDAQKHDKVDDDFPQIGEAAGA